MGSILRLHRTLGTTDLFVTHDIDEAIKMGTRVAVMQQGGLPLSHRFELTCGLLYPLLRGAAVHEVPSRRGADLTRVLNEQHDVLGAAPHGARRRRGVGGQRRVPSSPARLHAAGAVHPGVRRYIDGVAVRCEPRAKAAKAAEAGCHRLRPGGSGCRPAGDGEQVTQRGQQARVAERSSGAGQRAWGGAGANRRRHITRGDAPGTTRGQRPKEGGSDIRCGQHARHGARCDACWLAVVCVAPIVAVSAECRRSGSARAHTVLVSGGGH